MIIGILDHVIYSKDS